MKDQKTVTQEYIEGIREGRSYLNKFNPSLQDMLDVFENVKATAKKFAANTPVGQMLRGERDFWALQIKKAKSKQGCLS